MKFTEFITDASSDDDIVKFFGFDSYSKLPGDDSILVAKDHYIYKVFDRKGLGKLKCKSPTSRLLDNTQGPSFVRFNSLGLVSTLTYYRNGKRHKMGSAAHKEYNHKGMLVEEIYYRNDMVHNALGPANRFFCNGMWYNAFYINDVKFYLDSFIRARERHVKNINAQRVAS